PTYFDRVFTYAGPNRSLRGFLDAIEIFLETGFAVTALVTIVLNLTLPEELEETDEHEVAAAAAAAAASSPDAAPRRGAQGRRPFT
ncbi:hypothetical protein EKO27_g11473, partial [Xylaria grammica]